MAAARIKLVHAAVQQPGSNAGRRMVVARSNPSRNENENDS